MDYDRTGKWIMIGQVTKSTGSWYEVKTEAGETLQARLRGKFRIKGLKVNNPIAVGDWVELEKEEANKEAALITDILDRKNYIIRKSTRKNGFSHILASNIDQALLVATLSFPRTSLGFIDRFLVSAESFRIPSMIVFNKQDLMTEEDIEHCHLLMEMYKSLGYGAYLISAEKETGLGELLKELQGKSTLIAGHSGVGKSTLMNKLIPGLSLKTGKVSSFANKGTHTTTFAEMFEINNDSKIIDTPGIKELGLVDMESTEISHYFPEMRDYLGQCKYHNCTHTNEPHCAVLEAIIAGEIADSRFNSYLSILEDYDSHR